jgi:predicted O-methyltransferase YrrM
MNIAQHHIHRVLNKYLLDGMRDRKDMLALEALAPLSVTYLPWSQAAMRPSGLVAVLNDIVINGRSHIVECGSGISTFYIARLLKQRGGHIHTIEHDEAWAGLLVKALEVEGLSERATVVFAPLEEARHSFASRSGRNGSSWYAEDKLGCIRAKGKIDLLLVDGPPAYGKELRYARYPAVPFFKDYLADDYTVVLDDINRRGEQEIVERWERELGVKFDRRFIDGTIAVGRPRHSFSV